MSTLYFDDDGNPVPVISPEVYREPEPNNKRPQFQGVDAEVLRSIFGLLRTPAPLRIAGARATLLFSLFHPEISTGELLQLFPGTRRSDLVQVRLELASLLLHEKPDSASAEVKEAA